MNREEKNILINIAEILYQRGLITENEKNKMKDFMNGSMEK